MALKADEFAKKVDVVAPDSFGATRSPNAFLNSEHSRLPIRMPRCWLKSSFPTTPAGKIDEKQFNQERVNIQVASARKHANDWMIAKCDERCCCTAHLDLHSSRESVSALSGFRNSSNP